MGFFVLDGNIMAKKKTTEYFIKLAISKHGNKYGYDKTIYTGKSKEVEVYCNNCNKYFWTVASYHTDKKTTSNYKGCPKHTSNKKLTHEDFIKKSTEKHGNEYEYIEEYVKRDIPIDIKCKKCGIVFNVTPMTHIHARGKCPYCYPGGRPNKAVFIKKANEVHAKGHYNYDEFVYIDTDTKGKI